MKTVTFVEMDDCQVIANIENALPDPQETDKKVDLLIKKTPSILSQKTREQLLAENIVFSRLGPEQKNVEDAEGRTFQALLKMLGPREKLLLSGEKICDLRGAEYWIKQSGRWNKTKIEKLGENIPEGAVGLPGLSKSQQKEINEQTETERIAALTPEEKTAEKETALAAARHDVRIMKEDAEAIDEPFDAQAEYQTRKSQIEEKYA